MNNKYRYPVNSVTSCPTNAANWETAARRRNCSFDEVKPKNLYLCVPNQEKTEFLEFCYDEIRPMVQPGKYTCSYKHSLPFPSFFKNINENVTLPYFYKLKKREGWRWYWYNMHHQYKFDTKNLTPLKFKLIRSLIKSCPVTFQSYN